MIIFVVSSYNGLTYVPSCPVSTNTYNLGQNGLFILSLSTNYFRRTQIVYCNLARTPRALIIFLFGPLSLYTLYFVQNRRYYYQRVFFLSTDTMYVLHCY